MKLDKHRFVGADATTPFHAARTVIGAGEAILLPQLLPQEDRLFVAYCRSGCAELSGDGVEGNLAAGYITLLRAPLEAQLQVTQSIDITFIGLPTNIVTARLGRVEPLVGTTAAIPDGFALMFDGLAVAIARAPLEACLRYDAILGAATEFAFALIENLVPTGLGMTTHAQLLLARAKSIVNTRLDDPKFGASALASALGVGARYLRALFAAEGIRASDYIAAQRLRRGRRLLIDQANRHRAVADIARASGFVSQSHFARLIRHRFGLTPSALRAGRASHAKSHPLAPPNRTAG